MELKPLQKYPCNYKRVTGVITVLIGVITPSITGKGPTLYEEPSFVLFAKVFLHRSAEIKRKF